MVLLSQVVGSICMVARGEDVKAAEAECERSDYVIMDALDWKIIPAENLVAAFQVCPVPASSSDIASEASCGQIQVISAEFPY